MVVLSKFPAASLCKYFTGCLAISTTIQIMEEREGAE